MANDTLVSIFAPEAEAELDRIISKGGDLRETIVSINTYLKQGEFKIQGAENVTQLNAGLASVKVGLDGLGKAERDYQKEIERTAKVNERRLGSIAKANETEQKLAQELSNEYLQLSRAYNDAATKAKNYMLVLGQTNPLTIEAAKVANQLGDRLKTVDAAVGQFSRNVGNYNGVGAQFNQLLRELPNAGISFQTFLISLTNNISYFGEAIQVARKNGQSWGSILAGLGKQLFSLVGLINIAIVALVSMKDEIAALFDFTSDLEKANRKAIDSFVDETAAINLLKQELDNTNVSHERALQIRDELVKIAPALKDNLKDETNLTNDLYNAIELLNQAYLKQGVIKAAQELISEETKRYLKQDIGFFNQASAAIQGYIKSLAVGGKSMAIFVNTNAIARDKNEKMFQERTKSFFDIIQKTQEELNSSGLNTLLGSDTDKDVKKRKTAITDLTNTEISAAERIAAANAIRQRVALENEAQTQRNIFENEENVLGMRLDAYSKYLKARVQLNELAQDEELAKIQINLDKIAEIEGMTGKRTPAQIKLLEQKEAFEAEKAAIVDKYTIIENKIITDGQQDILKATQKAEDDIAAIVERHRKEEIAQEEEAARIRIDIEQRVQDAKKQLLKDGVAAAQELGNLLLDTDSKDIDERRKKIDEDAEIEKQRVQTQLATEEEKAAQILDIEQRANLEKKRLAKEEEDIEQQRFMLDKGAALASLAVDTAKSVAQVKFEAAKLKAASFTNPLLIPLIPLLLSQIPTILASSGIAAGVIGAQILAYAEGAGIDGRPVHPGGVFIAGEAGERELVLPKNKAPYWTGTTAAIYNEGVGTRVIPESKLHQNMAYIGGMGTMSKPSVTVNNNFEDSRIIRAIKENRPVVNITTVDNTIYRRLKGK